MIYPAKPSGNMDEANNKKDKQQISFAVQPAGDVEIQRGSDQGSDQGGGDWGSEQVGEKVRQPQDLECLNSRNIGNLKILPPSQSYRKNFPAPGLVSLATSLQCSAGWPRTRAGKSFLPPVLLWSGCSRSVETHGPLSFRLGSTGLGSFGLGNCLDWDHLDWKIIWTGRSFGLR